MLLALRLFCMLANGPGLKLAASPMRVRLKVDNLKPANQAWGGKRER